VIVPTAFEARVNAATFVRSDSAEVERHVLVPDVHPPDRRAGVPSREDPRSDVRVVVQARDDDLVAGPEGPPDRAGDREQQRGRVGPEHDLIGVGVQEVGRGEVRLLDHDVGLPARRERAVGVRVARAQVAGHRLDHGLGYL
jgi:hypothetical protein